MDDTIYNVTFVYDGYWKQVNSANGQKYVEGRQFTQLLDADKIALIDLREDIGPWSKTSNPRQVTFTYMLPNIIPRQFVDVTTDARLLEIFRENDRTKKFTLYVVEKEDVVAPVPTDAVSCQIDENENLNLYADSGIEELTVHDELYGEEEERHLDNNKEDDSELEEHSESEDGDCDGVFDEHTVEENKDQQKQDPLEEVGEQHSGSYSDHEVLSDACEGEFIEIDNEKPKMIVGSRFPSVFHFRDALKQHCIINEFAVKYIKNDLLRVTAKLGPMRSREEWEKVDLPFIVYPPKTVRPRGRPKRNRIRDPNEKNKRRHMCTRCREYGHHISTCKNPISNDSQGSGTVGRGSARGRGRGYGRGRGSLSVGATSRRGRSLGVRPSRRDIYKATRERPKIPTKRGGKAIQGPRDISETE
ncbi:hypothetical protein QJS10_CPB15g01512 [Acorus calamus]|uniref:Transposase MuDR plant domain-containing protein n=1 Tax=Acorus calamus TaxID=4465 RepID=A0AAV9D5S5_ACOCL|nr:hypothetical protein QJS10_CPB15g01512 [Acorus calamus]